MLNEFARDVARVQVGEDQYVGAAGHLAVGQLAPRNIGDDGGIHLQFAVEIRFELFLARLLLGQSSCCLHLSNGRMSRTALGGI